jgi:hypothetical protein
MRISRLLALLAALALLLAACGDNGDNGEDDEATGDPDAAEQFPDEQELPEDEAGAALPDDIAATVNGEEIPADEIDQRVEAVTGDPAVEEQMGGEGGEELEATARAQLLGQAILTIVALDAADELDNPVTDEDIADARAEITDQVGGEEAFDDAAAQAGLSEDQIDDDLRSLAALRNIQEVLEEEEGIEDDEGDEEDDAAAGDPQTMDPGEQLVQEFLSERLSQADIAVNPDYGQWDPQTGQVQPPGGMQMQPPAPEGGSPEELSDEEIEELERQLEEQQGGDPDDEG